MPSTANEDLADAIIGHRLDLLRFEAGTVRGMVRQWEAAMKPLTSELDRLGRKVQRGEALSPSDVAALSRLRTTVTTNVRGLHAGLRAHMDKSLTAATTIEGRQLVLIMETQLGTALADQVTSVPIAQLLTATSEPIGGMVWTSRLAVDLVEASTRLQGALGSIMANGQSIPNAARAIAAATGIQETYRGRLVSIARTEIQRVANNAALTTYQANLDIIKGVQYLATLDSRTCLICAPFHNKTYLYDENGKLPANTPVPPLHPRCIPAGAIVAGPGVKASVSRWYVGEVIDIETRDGRKLTVTPNHPVLTTGGWVAAGELHEGCDLVCARDAERMALAADPDHYQRPTLIEEVASTLPESGHVPPVPMPVAPEDFHGDGKGSKVYVVRPHGLLWHGSDTKRHQGPRYESLGFGSVHPALLDSQSGLHPPALGLGFAAGGFVRPGRQLMSRGCCHPAHAQNVRRAAASHLDSGVSESLGNERAAVTGRLSDSKHGITLQITVENSSGIDLDTLASRSRIYQPLGRLRRPPMAADIERIAHAAGADAEPLSDSMAAFASEVCVDRIVKYGIRRFSGHVYNLETRGEWYIANGIVTHNCRCFVSPLTKTWRELGLPGSDREERERFDGSAASGNTFDRWLRKQPAKTQLAVLGPARHGAWSSGSLSLASFTDQRSILTLDDLGDRYTSFTP